MNTKDLIKMHEGYRDRVYIDSVGVPTLGWGHALHVGSKVPRSASESFFNQDFAIASEGYKTIGLNLDDVRKAVCLDMIFNLGLSGFKNFKKMLAALRRGKYQEAADEMMDSKWAEQVGYRAVRLSKMMRSGRWPDP